MAAAAQQDFDQAGDRGYEGDATYDFPLNLEGLETHVLGAKPKHRLTEEEHFAREVERRRQQELERRHRIFDARRRNIGVDKEMLDAQVAEKQQRQHRDLAEDRRTDKDLLRGDRHMKIAEIQKQAIKKDMEKDCKEYSLRNLHFASRREHDLNDPLAVRKGTPARLGDTDERLGPSSMQMFNGEDLMREERVKQQKASMVNFIEQQKFEKKMLGVHDQQDTDGLAHEAAEIIALRNDMEERELELRRELQRSQQDDNIHKAIDNAGRRMKDMDDEQVQNASEVDFNYNDPMLNERGQVYTDGGRIRRDMYKGSNRSERVMVANQQILQRHEQDLVNGQQKRDDAFHHRQTEQTRRQMVAMEREKQRSRRAMMEDMASHNRSQDVVHKQSKKCLDQMYTNEFSADFFEQFGKGTR